MKGTAAVAMSEWLLDATAVRQRRTFCARIAEKKSNAMTTIRATTVQRPLLKLGLDSLTARRSACTTTTATCTGVLFSVTAMDHSRNAVHAHRILFLIVLAEKRSWRNSPPRVVNLATTRYRIVPSPASNSFRVATHAWLLATLVIARRARRLLTSLAAAVGLFRRASAIRAFWSLPTACGPAEQA